MAGRSGDIGAGIGCLVVIGAVIAAGVHACDLQRKADAVPWRSCPYGSELVGAHPPAGFDEWCQEETKGHSFRRHGLTRQWYPGGQLKAEGVFVHGVPDHGWRCWSTNGTLRKAADCVGPEGDDLKPPVVTLSHTIKPGESIWDIARLYGVQVAAIMHANGIDADGVQRLGVGAHLAIPIDDLKRVPDAVFDAMGRTVTVSHHEESAPERAARLGLGTPDVARRLLAGVIDPRWISEAALSGRFRGTLRWPVTNGWVESEPTFGVGADAMLISGEASWNVHAAADGIVAYAGDLGARLGLGVLIVHPGGWATAYSGNAENFVSAGDLVARSSVIAEMGTPPSGASPATRFKFFNADGVCDPAPLMRPGVRSKDGQLLDVDYTSWSVPDRKPSSITCIPHNLKNVAADSAAKSP